MATRRCEQCDGPLRAMGARGFSASYCSNACKQRAYRARKPKLPAELVKRDRWVLWKPVRRAGRYTKMPVQVDGSPASSTDPATWVAHSKVARAERRGFVLGDGIGCIDLDHCLVDGVPTPAAAAYLAQLPSTYIEVSPSGDGLHVWGLLPAGRGRVRKINGLHVEEYSAGRYITVTGNPFTDSVPHLADLSSSLGLISLG